MHFLNPGNKSGRCSEMSSTRNTFVTVPEIGGGDLASVIYRLVICKHTHICNKQKYTHTHPPTHVRTLVLTHAYTHTYTRPIIGYTSKNDLQ